MDRRTYIGKLEDLREDVLALQEANAQIEQLGTPDDFTEMESEARKAICTAIDKLADRFYMAGALSSRVEADNVSSGKGNQGDLYFANGDDGDQLPLGEGCSITHEDIAIAQEAEKARTAKAKKAKKGAK